MKFGTQVGHSLLVLQ